jgi:hypothetical protein
MLRVFGGRRSSVAAQRDLSSAGSIINTSGFRFWIGTSLTEAGSDRIDPPRAMEILMGTTGATDPT